MILSKQEQSKLRSSLFRHLDGLATAPTAFALYKKGVTDYLIENKKASLNQLVTEFKANDGYLNVALRILCSQGWLEQDVDNQSDTIHYQITDIGATAFKHVHLYEDAVELLKFSEKFHPRKFEVKPFMKLEALFQKHKAGYIQAANSDDRFEEDVLNQISSHIEGVILAPTIVHLGMSGMFHKYFMEARFKPEEFHEDPVSFQKMLDIFVHFGWFSKADETYQFTEKGFFFAKRASAYGVTVSYIPTLRKLDDLIFGNPRILREAQGSNDEVHVDREMNVWGSGGAHANYFKVVDEIVIDLFNKPIDEQPKGILDMGCGNGAFLQHLFYIIEKHTLRGKMLDEYPLTLVGADFNRAALKVTKANLIQADIWAKVVWGDIGRPDLLAQDLKDSYNVELKDLLNVRTFLDHNRIWKKPITVDPNRVSTSTGAFAFEGKRINNNLTEESLIEHIQNWKPYVEKFGLLVIELHTVPPELVAQNLGRTGATAYDATHGYSDQYILEVDVFLKTIEEAGLIADPKVSKKFPNSDLATVTINLFKAKS